MRANGTAQKSVSAGTDKGGTRPAWSAAGTKIVFSSSGYTAPNGPDIFTMTPDGKSVKRLATAVPASDLDPTWQPVAPTKRLPTYTTLNVSAGADITASGELFTAHPGQSMTVTLFKKVGTSFQKVRATSPVLGAFGTYATSFAAPSAATCKVVARFGGDADHLASQKAVTFSC
ncbi:MAG TPA: hypothetical protein VGP51_03850 [Nocardioidaceae bacterium]|nr:hypothetical protein [Nocardioidaceae bacterium]